MSKNKSDKKQNEQSVEESYIEKGIEVVLPLLKTLLEVVEDDTQAWFADLIGVDEDAFLALPVDTEAKIIEQIVNASEAVNFFTIASRIFNVTDWLQKKLEMAKTKLDII